MTIQKRDDISYKEFMEEFYNPGIPVVFKNASKVWKANGLFTPGWFRDNYGERVTQFKDKSYTMREVLDMVERSTESNPAPYPFLFSIPGQIPELFPLVTPLNLGYAKPNWLERKWFQRGYWGSATEVFIGGAGG